MSSMFAKSEEQSAGPYFSMNPKITDQSLLSDEPSPEVLEVMEQVDPPLEDSWVIWEQHKPPKDKTTVGYADAMRKTGGFKTVKEFWGCWKHMPSPSDLLDSKKFVREEGGSRSVIDCLAIFREGVVPQWEDPQNADGGHFQVTLKPTLPGGLIDELWNNTVLGMISGAIEPSGMLMGVRLVDKLDHKMKPNLRIELWLNDYDEDARKGGQGKVYGLRGSFENCMRIGLDGREKPVTWTRTETVPHNDHKR